MISVFHALLKFWALLKSNDFSIEESTFEVLIPFVIQQRQIRDAGIPYKVPDTTDLPARIDAVLTMIYLIFNEGYAATRGEAMIRADLCAEAIRLGRFVRTLMSP